MGIVFFIIKENELKNNFFKLETPYSQLLLSLGSWFSLTKRTEELPKIIPDYKFQADYTHIIKTFELICKRTFENSNRLQTDFKTKVPYKKRFELTEKVNKKQVSLLEKIHIKSLNSRNLVLYYRTSPSNDEKQMDDFDFFLICYILNKYIEKGYSKLFTSIKLVSRNSNIYPKFIHKLFKNIQYLDTKRNEFINKTSVKSNLINFNSGSASQQIKKHSHSIVPITYKTHRDYKKEYDKYLVFTNLIYWSYNEKNFIKINENEIDSNESIETVMCEIIRAVKELEDKIIADAEE